MNSIIFVLIAFQIKHFVCDFPLQAFPYMYQNKGKYGHLGGILHASIHLIGTLMICSIAGLPIWLAFFDGLVHYHIDWAKMKINNKFGWKPDNNEKFWILLGVDQLLHQLTYLIMIGVVI